MNPFALIVVLVIIIGAILVFSPVSLRSIISSFPLFANLNMTNKELTTTLSNQQAMIWRTVDGGVSWFAQSAVEADKGLPEASILDIKFDKENSNIIYAGTEGAGLYRSFNNGQNWEKVIDNNNSLANNASVFKVAQDKNNVNNIYLAIFQNKYGMFLKSTDGGISFNRTYIAQLENYPVTAVAVNPSAGNIIYMGTSQGGFFASKDYGETWNALKWISGRITDIIISPQNSDEIYIVTGDRGIFRSEDGGRAWQGFSKELSRISARQNTSKLVISPTGASRLYLAIANGLIKSADHGKTWEFVNALIPPKALPVDTMAIDPKEPDRLHMGVGTLIYKTEDGGINWSVQKLDINKRIAIMVIDEKDPMNILMGLKVIKKK